MSNCKSNGWIQRNLWYRTKQEHNFDKYCYCLNDYNRTKPSKKKRTITKYNRKTDCETVTNKESTKQQTESDIKQRTFAN